MDRTRKIELFEDAISWVWGHCPDTESYVRALKCIGFTREEAWHDLFINTDMDEDDAEALVHSVYDSEK